MRYFAMIDGEQRGPFELEELTAAGVRPDTYVWCKGMADWEKAEDVADICRHYRLTIFDRMHPSRPASPQPTEAARPGADEANLDQVPLRYRHIFNRAGETPEFTPEHVDTSTPPMPTLWMAVMVTIFCFPITGFVAVYFAFMSRKTWMEATSSLKKRQQALYTDQEREQLRSRAHDYNRSAKMWIGITFFLGLILYAAMINFNL